MRRRVLVIDNRDSFVFNLVESFRRLGAEVAVYRNDVRAERLLDVAHSLARRGSRPLVVLSPGPGEPRDAGSSPAFVELVRGHFHVLGVCLGHQLLLEAAGAKVERAGAVVHGRSSELEHDGRGPFAGLPSPVAVGRYHSLGVREAPPCFRVHAVCDGLVMAASDPEARRTGLQFHPESILTPVGDRLLRNVLDAAEGDL